MRTQEQTSAYQCKPNRIECCARSTLMMMRSTLYSYASCRLLLLQFTSINFSCVLIRASISCRRFNEIIPYDFALPLSPTKTTTTKKTNCNFSTLSLALIFPSLNAYCVSAISTLAQTCVHIKRPQTRRKKKKKHTVK